MANIITGIRIVCSIALIKMINIISGFVVQKRLVTVHSVMNNITGVLLFILPLTVRMIDLRYSVAAVCAIAAFAAVQEGYYIRNKTCAEESRWNSEKLR